MRILRQQLATLAVILPLSMTGCITQDNATLRKVFDLPTLGELHREQIAKAVAQKFPIGTSITEVRRALPPDTPTSFGGAFCDWQVSDPPQLHFAAETCSVASQPAAREIAIASENARNIFILWQRTGWRIRLFFRDETLECSEVTFWGFAF